MIGFRPERRAFSPIRATLRSGTVDVRGHLWWVILRAASGRLQMRVRRVPGRAVVVYLQPSPGEHRMPVCRVCYAARGAAQDVLDAAARRAGQNAAAASPAGAGRASPPAG